MPFKRQPRGNCAVCGLKVAESSEYANYCGMPCYKRAPHIMERSAADSRARRKENSRYGYEAKKRWAEKNKDKLNAKNKAWREADPERARAAVRKSYQKDLQKSRIMKRDNQSRRRTAEKTGRITPTQWERILIAAKYRCHWCKNKFDNLEMDHVIPLSRGGAHNPSNIVPACERCNCSKGAKIITLL